MGQEGEIINTYIKSKTLKSMRWDEEKILMNEKKFLNGPNLKNDLTWQIKKAHQSWTDLQKKGINIYRLYLEEYSDFCSSRSRLF
jgi:hypothetical protein